MPASSPLSILVVGAGAVGQAYGFHLQRGGARVTFFVKPKYVANLRDSPMTLHQLFVLSASERRTFKEYEVVSTEAEVRAGHFDVVIFTLPQDALRASDFAKQFVGWCNPDATIVATSSGYGDLELFRNEIGVEPSRLCYNHISIISWQAPVPNERFTPVPPADGPNKAIGYFAPDALPVDGPADRVLPLVAVFNKGGLKAAHRQNVKAYVAERTAFFHSLLVALEVCNWSFSELRGSPLLATAVAAGQEAMAINALESNTPPPWIARWLIGTWTVSFLIRAAESLMPFDFERYMQYHFTKVGDQTIMIVENMIQNGESHNLPTANIKKLLLAIPRYQATHGQQEQEPPQQQEPQQQQEQ